jgi:uncharacterized protein
LQTLKLKSLIKGDVFMRTLDAIALLLVIIGAVNWGLIGFFQFDLVAALFGEMSAISRVIYALVGIAGLYAISFYAKDRDRTTSEQR